MRKFLLAMLLIGLVAASGLPQEKVLEPEKGEPAAKEKEEAEEEGPPAPTHPSQGEVRLPAHAGWHASLVMDNEGVGVWTVKSFPLFPEFACPEVVALDDMGRCRILVSYSGRWSYATTVNDGRWLGGLVFEDVDPRIEGRELYTGSQRGNLYQVVTYPEGDLDTRLIARLPGREIHTVVAGELDPRNDCPEVLLFTRPGALYRVTPTGENGRFETTHLSDYVGRVRDALVLPGGREVACVARTGHLRLLNITKEGVSWTTIHSEKMGMGRIALRPDREDGRLVLYTTLDDGRIQRHVRWSADRWTTETIYHGPLGPRGLAAGRFSDDPKKETLAIFGYSGRVELLSREEKGWTATTIFVDKAKGHWLATAEVDGRNSTDEIVASGFGGRVILLSRPPGYGREELAEEEGGAKGD